MKKKLVLVVAIVLVAITACACLAGCVPSRPDKFVESWAKSGNKAMVVMGQEIGINGNKIIVKTNDENMIIYEEKSDSLNVYTCALGKWTAVSIEMTKEEAKQYKELKEGFKSDKVDGFETVQNDFEKNFEKKDGKWVGKGLLAAVSFEINGNELSMSTIGVELPMKLILNYKISIPAEAKAALK